MGHVVDEVQDPGFKKAGRGLYKGGHQEDKDPAELVCVDLFSGLGGWSQAFTDNGWKVLTIDNDPSFNPHICKDIMDLDASILPVRPTVILASPPCQKFSPNTIKLNWKKRVVKDWGVVTAIGLVGKVLHIVGTTQPRYWIMENPRGMLRNVMGKPKVTTFFRSWGAPNLKPTDLWGILPPMEFPPPPPGWDKDGTRLINDSAIAAKIPYQLSDAVRVAIEEDVYVDI